MKGSTLRTLAAAAALTLIASQALAATYHVNPRAASTTGSGADSSTNAFLRFGQADSVAQPGDMIRVLGGVYAKGPRPLRSGTAGSYITYASYPTVNKANVTITASATNVHGDATSNALVLFRDYISVRGFTFTGGGCEFATKGINAGAAHFDSVAWCSFLPADSTSGSFSFGYSSYCPTCPETASDNVFYRNTIKVGATTIRCEGADCSQTGGNGQRAFRNVIRGNLMSFTPPASNSEACLYWEGMTDHVVDSNTVWLTHKAGTSATLAFWKLYVAKRNRFSDNHWRIQQTVSGRNSYFYMRDSSQFNKFTRDTFNVVGPYTAIVLLNNTGAETDAYQIETKGNRWHRCVFRNPWGEGPQFYNAYAHDDTVSYCTFISRSNTHLIDSKRIAGTVVIDHNTFADSAANAPGVIITTPTNCPSCFTGTLKLTNNLFYHKDTTGTGNSNLRLKVMPAKFYADNNYFALRKTSTISGTSFGMASVAFDSADASGNLIGSLRYSRPDSITYRRATGISTYSNPDPLVVTDFNDLNSRTTGPLLRRGPLFVDSLIYSFDATLGAGSGAIGVGMNGTDAGSFQSVADTTRPSAVADFTLAYSGTNYVFEFTAPGDDAASGTAVSYEIRYSPSLINGENFAAASLFPGTYPCAVAGSFERFEMASLPGGPYWFAVKAVDEAGNKGAVSNVVKISPPGVPIISFSDTTTTVMPSGEGSSTVTFTVTNAGMADLVITGVDDEIVVNAIRWFPLFGLPRTIPEGASFDFTFTQQIGSGQIPVSGTYKRLTFYSNDAARPSKTVVFYGTEAP